MWEEVALEAKGEKIIPVRLEKGRCKTINKKCWNSQSAALHNIQQIPGLGVEKGCYRGQWCHCIK